MINVYYTAGPQVAYLQIHQGEGTVSETEFVRLDLATAMLTPFLEDLENGDVTIHPQGELPEQPE